MIDHKGRPACVYLARNEFAYFVNGSKQEAYICTPRCGASSMDKYIHDRKRNVNSDRLKFALKHEEPLIPNKIAFMRDPVDRCLSAYRFQKRMAREGHPNDRHLAGKARGKANLANNKEFVDVILSTQAGVPEFLHESWIPVCELLKDRQGNQRNTEWRKIDDIGLVLPNFPVVAAESDDEVYDLNYRKADLEAFYAEDIAIWNAIQ